MGKKLLCCLMVLSLTAVLLSARSSSAADGTKTPEAIRIGIAMSNMRIPIFAGMIRGMQNAANTNYKYMTLDFQDAQDDGNIQMNQIETFMAQGVDVIMVNPAVDAMEPALRSATEQGVPVIMLNRDITNPDKSSYFCYVGADNVEMGRQLCRMLMQMIDEKGLETCNVIYMQGELGAPNQAQRQQGFDEILKTEAADYKINILDRFNTQHDKGKVISAMQNYFNMYMPGEIDAVVCEGPFEAVGVVEVIKEAGRNELLGRAMGMDLPKEVWELIDSGDLYGTVQQDPVEQGVLGLQTVEQYFSGDKVAIPKWIKTQVPLITKKNVAETPAVW
jgi:ABC-type sugar transport system substrate-binding protein